MYKFWIITLVLGSSLLIEAHASVEVCEASLARQTLENLAYPRRAPRTDDVRSVVDVLSRVLPAATYPVKVLKHAPDVEAAFGVTDLPAAADQLVIEHQRLGEAPGRGSVWLLWRHQGEVVHRFYVENVENGSPVALSVEENHFGYAVSVHARYSVAVPNDSECTSSYDVRLEFAKDGTLEYLTVLTDETTSQDWPKITRCASTLKVARPTP